MEERGGDVVPNEVVGKFCKEGGKGWGEGATVLDSKGEMLKHSVE